MARRLFFSLVLSTGCAGLCADSPTVTVSQIEPYEHSAKPSDCSIPVLYSEPKGKFRKIAIIEGWDDPEHRAELFTAIIRSACETGADALLIIADRAQTSERLVYDPSNEEPGAAGNPSAEVDTGQAIIRKEHTARIGEAGHAGYYIDAYAFVLNSQK
jgi:hypothetical protein